MIPIIRLTEEWMNGKVTGARHIYDTTRLVTLSKSGKQIVKPNEIRPIGVGSHAGKIMDGAEKLMFMDYIDPMIDESQ